MENRAKARYALTIIALVNLAAVLVGCAATPATVTVVAPRAPVAVPSITPLTLDPVQWQVLNAAQLAAKAADLRRSGGVLYGLDQTNYQSLSIDLVEIQRFMRDQAAVIALLKAVIDPNAVVTSAPTLNTQSTDSILPPSKQTNQ